jgi:hypothetical protein
MTRFCAIGHVGARHRPVAAQAIPPTLPRSPLVRYGQRPAGLATLSGLGRRQAPAENAVISCSVSRSQWRRAGRGDVTAGSGARGLALAAIPAPQSTAPLACVA